MMPWHRQLPLARAMMAATLAAALMTVPWHCWSYLACASITAAAACKRVAPMASWHHQSSPCWRQMWWQCWRQSLSIISPPLLVRWWWRHQHGQWHLGIFGCPSLAQMRGQHDERQRNSQPVCCDRRLHEESWHKAEAAQQEVTQQPAGALMRGGGATRGSVTRRRHNVKWHHNQPGRTRGKWEAGGRGCAWEAAVWQD